MSNNEQPQEQHPNGANANNNQRERRQRRQRGRRVQEDMERLSIHDDMEVDDNNNEQHDNSDPQREEAATSDQQQTSNSNQEREEITITKNTNDSPLAAALNTLHKLKMQADHKDALFQETVINDKPQEEQANAMRAAESAQEKVDMYRRLCSKKYPLHPQFQMQPNTLDVISNTEQDGKQKDSHIVPKELPALQIVGNEKWNPMRKMHLSTEMFLRAFVKELQSCGLKPEDHWQRLMPKCLDDTQSLWLDDIMRENPDYTWADIRQAFIDKFDTPEQKLISMEVVLHMRQKPDEDIRTYTKRFVQRSIETGLDKYHVPMIVALLSSLQNKHVIYNLVSTKFGSSFIKQSLETIAHYISGLHVQSNNSMITNKRMHEGSSTHDRSPVKRPRSPYCSYCGRLRENSDHRCNEYLISMGRKPLPHLPKAKQMVNRSAAIVNDDDVYDGLPCKSHIKKQTECDEMLIPVTIEGQRIHALLDDGATFSSVSNKFCQITGIKIIPIHGYIQLASMQSKIKRIGITELLDLWYNGRHIQHSFEVMDLARNKQASIGKDLFNAFRIGYTGLAHTWDDALEQNEENEFDDTHTPPNVPACGAQEYATFMQAIQPSLDRNAQIPSNTFCDLDEAIITIPTPPEAYCHRRQYTIPYNLQPVVQEAIDKWLADYTITIVPANADNRWNNPITLAPKKDDQGRKTGYRPCLDPRLINQYLKDDNYPIPLISTIFDKLQGAIVYTTLDLASAFHRFPIHPDDQHKTAFTGPDGTRYMFKGCPFGLKPISSKFQRVMDLLFRDLPYVTTFVDDIIIYSRTLEAHTQHVIYVVNRLTDANLILQPKKCFFMQACVHLLGFYVNQHGHKPDPRKVTNAQQWPIPQTARDVQAYLGFINYFRDYIPYIADITNPLNELRNTPDIHAHWNDSHTHAFNTLKYALLNAPLLSFPNMQKRFHVATDASNVGIAAVLYQKHDNKKHIISYMARALTKSERNYMVTKKELRAIIFAFNKFHKYLWGNRFTLYTDHKALTYLHQQKDLNSMLTNWFDTIYQYNFDIVHIAGRLNGMSDSLSRLFHCGTRSEGGSKDTNNKDIYDDYQGNIPEKINRAASIIKDNTVEPPQEERQQILRNAHLLGHFGANAIIQTIHNNGLHWEHLKKDATDMVMSCPP